jgi:hypothetical protein
MKTQTLKPLLARINSQLADILTKYETGQKQIAFDNSPAFDRFLNLTETVLPIMPKLTKPDFDSFSRLVNEFQRVTELHLNNPVFATCFVQLENYDQTARTKFETDFASISLNCRWETGFPFSLFMVTGEIPNWTANTFQKMFYTVQTLENPQGTITHQKRPKQGFDKFIELENHNLVPQFKAERPQNEIFDLLNFAEFQFVEFCQQSILKARQIKSHQEQLLEFCRLQDPKAHPGKKAVPPAGFDCSLTHDKLKKLCFALAQNCRFIDSSTNPDHFIAAFRPEPLPDGFEKIRWFSDTTELTFLISDSRGLRNFLTLPKQIWKQTETVFSDQNGNPLKNLRQAQNHRLSDYPQIYRIVEKIML